MHPPGGNERSQALLLSFEDPLDVTSPMKNADDFDDLFSNTEEPVEDDKWRNGKASEALCKLRTRPTDLRETTEKRELLTKIVEKAIGPCGTPKSGAMKPGMLDIGDCFPG
jgi:hypothetical protein